MQSRGRVWQSAMGLGLLFFAVVGCAPLEPTPPEPQKSPPALRSAPKFEPVGGTEGPISEATLFVEKMPSIGAHLEIRTLSVRPDDHAVLPIEHEVVLEMRSGEIEITINGKREKHFPGDIWIVAPKSRVTMNVLGQLAVLRAIYLVREPQ